MYSVAVVPRTELYITSNCATALISATRPYARSTTLWRSSGSSRLLCS